MSLYNMVAGNNPLFGLFGRILDTEGDLPEVPRFRDCYTTLRNGKVEIVVYTRTGGGNRGSYEAENSGLAKHPLYIFDTDDDFDSTFAHFHFSVPVKFKENLTALHTVFSKYPKGQSPRQKMNLALDRISAPITPEDPSGDLKADSDELSRLVEWFMEQPELSNESSLERQLQPAAEAAERKHD